MVFRNFFDTLSSPRRQRKQCQSLDDLLIISKHRSPFTCVNQTSYHQTKHQKCKTFHSKQKMIYATLMKKQSPNGGMTSGHSFMKNQPSPMANEIAQFSILTSKKLMTLPISPISLKFNFLLELEHIITMELQRRPSKPSCLLQEL